MKAWVVALIVGQALQISPSSKLTRYIGSYVAGDENVWVLVDKDRLVMMNASGKMQPLTPSTNANTYTAPGNLTVEFGTDGSRLTIRDGAGTRHADKYRAPKDVLPNYVGVYHLSGGFVFAVTLEGDHLSVQGNGQAKIPIWPESKNRFFVHEPGKLEVALLEFTTDSNGRVTTVTIQQNGAQDTGSVQQGAK